MITKWFATKRLKACQWRLRFKCPPPSLLFKPWTTDFRYRVPWVRLPARSNLSTTRPFIRTRTASSCISRNTISRSPKFTTSRPLKQSVWKLHRNWSSILSRCSKMNISRNNRWCWWRHLICKSKSPQEIARLQWLPRCQIISWTACLSCNWRMRRPRKPSKNERPP